MAGSLCSESIWDSGLVPQEEDEKGIPHLKPDEGWQLANRMGENRETWCVFVYLETLNVRPHHRTWWGGNNVARLNTKNTTSFILYPHPDL